MILEDLGAEIFSQREAGIEAEVVEDGATFEENALIKAKEIAKAAGKMPGFEDAVVLADDSGLEIDYLNKEPERPPLPALHLYTVCGGLRQDGGVLPGAGPLLRPERHPGHHHVGHLVGRRLRPHRRPVRH